MDDEEFEEWITSDEYLEDKAWLNRIKGLLVEIRNLLKILTIICFGISSYALIKVLLKLVAV